jgi:hypothetical protein
MSGAHGFLRAAVGIGFIPEMASRLRNLLPHKRPEAISAPWRMQCVKVARIAPFAALG